MSNVYPHAVRYSALVKSVNKTAGTGTEDLAPFEMGLIDPETYKTVLDGADLTSMRVAVGSPNQPRDTVSYVGFTDKFNRRTSMKSMELKNVLKNSFHVNVPSEATGFVGYYGYNGLPNSTSMEFNCGKTEEYEVQVYGDIVKRLYGKYEVFERFSVNVDECADPEVTVADDCGKYVERLVTSMNDPRNGNNKVRRFGSFSVVRSCTTAPTVTEVAANLYTISLCDNGDASALAFIKSRVAPALRTSVTRIARVGSTSTYQICATSAPDSLTQLPTVSLAVCGDCPVGYTTVPEVDVYVIKTALDPATEVTTPAEKAAVVTSLTTAYTATANGAASFLSIENSVAAVELYFPVGTVVAPIGTDSVEFIGTKEAICIAPIPTPIAWTVGEDRTKLSRVINITIKKDDCGEDSTDVLAEIEAFYANLGNPISNITTDVGSNDCLVSFSAEQTSEGCFSTDCDTNEYTQAWFKEVTPFRGQVWTPVEADDTYTGCACGIKVKSNPINCDLGGCGYDTNEFAEYDVPMFKIVKVTAPLSLHEDTSVGPIEDSMWFEAQRPTRKMLDGHAVIKDILLYRAYRGEIRFSPAEAYGMKFIEAEGNVYGIQPCSKYYVLHITGDYGEQTSLSASFGDKHEDIQLFFESRVVLEDAIQLLSGFAANFKVSLQWN